MAHLRWLEPEDANVFSINNYIVKLKKHGQKFDWKDKITTEHFILDSRLEDLEEGMSYIVKVLAKGNGGNGLDSDQEDFKTKGI
jgi:hypothetical protein